ncbi:hypothetical protein [Candidatus Ruminimicrobium bovinum]|uniref:hypothetical protein n=1 Tax=Candidatus Ruminimicrobium bovinum TaxID=3242779 RepID=UPI0039B8CC3C
MDLVSFQRDFRNMEVDIFKYIKVVSILILCLLIIIIKNNKIEDYYFGISKVINNKIEVLIDLDRVNKIKENNKIIIERNTFTYEIEKIDDYLIDNNYYKKVTLLLKDNKIKENEIVKYQIIINKETLLEYLFRTIKGDEKY